MSEIVVWQGCLDHPARMALPCRVVVRERDVVTESDWGSGFRRSVDPSDAPTIMAAALRDMTSRMAKRDAAWARLVKATDAAATMMAAGKPHDPAIHAEYHAALAALCNLGVDAALLSD